jgi:hypothetical protein
VFRNPQFLAQSFLSILSLGALSMPELTARMVFPKLAKNGCNSVFGEVAFAVSIQNLCLDK